MKYLPLMVLLAGCSGDEDLKVKAEQDSYHREPSTQLRSADADGYKKIDGICSDAQARTESLLDSDGEKAPTSIPDFESLVGYLDFPPEDPVCVWTQEDFHVGGVAYTIFNDSNGYHPGNGTEVLARCGATVNVPWEKIISEMKSVHGNRSLIEVDWLLSSYFGNANPLWSKQAPKILASDNLSSLYTWAFPGLLAAWNAELDNGAKRRMLSDIQHARDYLRADFNYQEELTYYQALEGMDCGTSEQPSNCTHYFTTYGPRDNWSFAIANDNECKKTTFEGDNTWEERQACLHRSPEGRRGERYIETALFRRVNNNELTPDTMSYWLDRSYRDLQEGFTYTP